MYFLRERSSGSEDPVFFKLPASSQNDKTDQVLLFPEFSVAKWFYESGIAERALINWVSDNLIRPDKAFVDIGAHVGTYTWTCGKKAKHTYAFECSPKTFCYLAANVALHEMEYKVTLNSCALGPTNTTQKYYIRSNDGGGNGVKYLTSNDDKLPHVDVTVRTLDSFEINNIGLIKIDVEGFEKEVLMGSIETLKKNEWPNILFECWGEWKEKEGVAAKALRQEVFAFLEALNYNIIPLTGVSDMFLAEIKPL